MIRFVAFIITSAVVLFSALPHSHQARGQVSPGRLPETKAGQQAGNQEQHQLAIRVFARQDKDADGRITEDEAAPGFWRAFSRYDVNGDNALDKDEFTKPVKEGRLRFGGGPGGVGGGPRGGSPSLRAFARNDKNSDGRITKDEAEPSFWSSVAGFDANEDGAIDRDEYQQWQRERSLQLGMQRFAGQDENGDGKLSKEEATIGLFPRLVDRFDANGDGFLDKDEFVKAIKEGRIGFGGGSGGAQPGQSSDASFKPTVENPAYEDGNGPLVLVDEAHFNYHTISGRFAPFGDLLKTDGYVVTSLREPVTPEVLKDCRILVISNSLAEQNQRNWRLPTPSAFSDEEIAVIDSWVGKGGSLLLIADHMPFAGAAQKLAAAFGARYSNGFAINEGERGKPMLFRRSEQLLADHPITNGRDASERIDFVATFTGSAFQADETFRPILTFGESVVSLTPEVAWRFTDDTTRIPVAGWCQGAAKRHGKGRAAFFGEAAMFTAQRAGGRSIGMSSPDAEQNAQFVLNVLHWLSGLLD